MGMGGSGSSPDFTTCLLERRIFTFLYRNTNSCGFRSVASKFLLLLPVSMQICLIIILGEIPLTFLKINMLLKNRYLLASPKGALV